MRIRAILFAHLLVLGCSTTETRGSPATGASTTSASSGAGGAGTGGSGGAGASGGRGSGGAGACAARSEACTDCTNQRCASVAAVCETDPETDASANCKAAFQIALDCACAAQGKGDVAAADACFATFHESGPRAGGFDDCLEASCKPACGL